MRRDLSTCSSQSAMHHGVPVRVFFRRSSEHHSRNDSSSSTSWSHDSHVFFSYSYLGRTRNFLEGSVQKHSSPCGFRKRVGRKEKNTEQDQPAVRFIFHLVFIKSWKTSAVSTTVWRLKLNFSSCLWNSLFTRKQNAREWKKADAGIYHQTEKSRRRRFFLGGLFRRRRFFFVHFPPNAPEIPRYNKNKSEREITTTSSSHVGEKESSPCTTVFGEKIGMLLCRPYVVSLNFPLATRTRHLSGTS